MNWNREKILEALPVSLFFSSTIFLFGPFSLYFTNILEYSSSFSDLWYFHALATGTSCLILAGMLSLLNASIYKRALSLLFGLSVLLWLQGNIFVWSYGQLDGSDINWQRYTLNGIIDSSIWIVFIFISIVANNRISKIARNGSAAFLVIQAVSCVLAAAQAPDASTLHQKNYNEKELYSFSTEENVLILLLDSFQGDIFHQIIEEDAPYRKFFDGFTYYRNALGGYPSTYASIPLIMTGHYYDNSIPILTFIRNIYRDRSLPKMLKERGYQVDVIGGGRTVYGDPEIINNHAGLGDLVQKHKNLHEAAFLFDMTLFRYLPHYTKKHIYNNQSWRFSNLLSDKQMQDFPPGYQRESIRFLQELSRQATGDSDKHTFKYVHTYASHPPVRFNEKIEYREMDNSRENYVMQAKGVLHLVEDFLETLKRIGAFDNTLIFIIADHGAGYPVEMGGQSPHDADVRGNTVPEKIKGQALPLFLVKPIHASGSLAISDAPVSLADIVKTVASELRLSEEVPGVSVFEVAGSDMRERRFLFYAWNHSYWKSKYLPPMKEYLVSGEMWMSDSWIATNRQFTKDGIRSVSSQICQFNLPIVFGADGNYVEYEDVGWAKPEKDYTMIKGSYASLKLPLPSTKADIWLRTRFESFFDLEKSNEQEMRVFINGAKAGEWRISGNGLQEQVIFIPNNYLTGQVEEIAFELPGLSEAPASIRMRSISLSEGIVGKYEWGSPIQFGRNGNAMAFQENGWNEAEETFTWTSGKTSSLTIPVHETAEDIELEAEAHPFIVPGTIDRQEARVFVQNQHVGTLVFEKRDRIWSKFRRDRGFSRQAIVIPHNLLTGPQVKITFELPGAVSPSEMGMSDDERKLALAFRSVILKKSSQR